VSDGLTIKYKKDRQRYKYMSKMSQGDIISVVPLKQTNSGWYFCPIPIVISKQDIIIPKNEFEKSKYQTGDRVVVKYRHPHNGRIVASIVDDRKQDIDYSAADFGRKAYKIRHKDSKVDGSELTKPNKKKHQPISKDQDSKRKRTESEQEFEELQQKSSNIDTQDKLNNSEASKTDSSEAREDLEMLRKQAEEAAVDEVPHERRSTKQSAPQYNRSQEVKSYAKARADGICEGCGETAPFISKTGEPYLHVHHIFELSEGGSDTPDTVAALCPNCHYRIHHGEDGKKYNQEILENIEDIEK